MEQITREKPLPSVAVVGAGLMGHGIAQVFALAGAPVRVWDPNPGVLNKVPERIRAHLDAMGIDAAVKVSLCDSLSSAVTGADLVIEATPEILHLKQNLMGELDRLAPQAVVATNTSVLRSSDIAEGSTLPHRVI